MYNLLAYSIYLTLALIVVLVVGGILFRNGRFFLVDVFGSEPLADTCNRLLYLGYCLINAGMALYHLNTLSTLSSYAEVMGFIASNTGSLFLLLGGMHYLNLLVLPVIGKHYKRNTHLKH